MIARTLKYLAQEVNNHFDNPVTPAIEELVVPGNISRLESGADASNADLQTRVVLTLVNIEEEKTLKNGPYYRKNADKSIDKFNPTLHVNLYLLFSCADSDYETALHRISQVVGFFQGHNVFTAETAEVPFPEGLEKIILDLFSLNFEQTNHLWGVLGGKYIPSVLYKARLLAIQESPEDKADVIKEIKTNERLN